MRPRGSLGIALVAVLWSLVLLSVITLGFVVETRTETRLAFNAGANAQARAFADAGIHRGLLALIERSRGPTIGLAQRLPEGSLTQRSDRDASDPFEAGNDDEVDPLSDPSRWRWDGSVTSWRFGTATIGIAIQDEGGKIDLNTAADPLLRSLFEVVGLPRGDAEALVDAVNDFSDADDLRRINGAEQDDYAAAGLDYGPKNEPFELVEELQQVLGMSRNLYEALAPALTVYSGAAGIDPRPAPPLALLALPETEPAMVEQYLQDRADGDPDRVPILSADPAYFSDSRRTAFTLRATATTDRGGVFVREAVVEIGGGPGEPYRILDWRRGRLGETAKKPADETKE